VPPLNYAGRGGIFPRSDMFVEVITRFHIIRPSCHDKTKCMPVLVVVILRPGLVGWLNIHADASV
jgi:hypothetical protein